MYNSIKIKYITLFFVLAFVSCFAQDNPLKISGKFSTDQRFRTEKPNTWSWNENRIDLSLNKKFEDKAKFYSNIWFRSFGFPNLISLGQLTSKDQTSPFNIDLREAYVDINNFIVKDMSLKIGRQKFNWGTGDKLNPVNTLNPLDLEDIWDFGRYHGSDAIKLSYSIKKFDFEGMWIPFFKPITMPQGDWVEAFISTPELPAGITLNSLDNKLTMPDLTLKQSSSYGFKGSGSFGKFDLSLYYSYFNDQLPSPDKNVIQFAGSFTKVNIISYQQFIRLHSGGLSFTGELFNMGVWGEFAAFMPEKELVMKTDLSAFGLPEQDSLILEKKPWYKFLIGTDYTFKDGSYFNFQYLHGFFQEKGNDKLNDYFTLAWYKTFLHDQLKITPVSGCFIVADWTDVGNNYVFIYNPEISYKPNDNTELIIGVRIIDGKGGSTFALVKDKDEIFFGMRYNF